ncbi:MAG: Lrp/AsnC family transcriptional regulator [Proteobacteria bacterium]|nr:Lrp/AsnC family transcriptional regulator [Pseudomonadota bacterium]
MIDETNLKILSILQQKARVPNVEVARQVNMAPSAVLERIRKLEKQGIIDGYEVILNPKCLNRDMVAFVHVYLHHASQSDQTGPLLARIPEIQEIHFVTGKDCFLVKIRVSGTAALGETLTQKIGAIAEVKRTETTIVLKTYKESSQIPLDSVNISEIIETPHHEPKE